MRPILFRSISILGAFVSVLLSYETVLADTDAPSIQSSTRKAISKVGKALKSKGVTKVPSTSSAVSSASSSSSLGDITLLSSGVLAITGTVPKLTEIPTRTAKNLFWEPGVVDAIASGTPTQNQCGSFFAGPQDGTSGGLGACHMAEDVGHTFEILLHSETGLCYLKRFPTNQNLQAGGIEVIKGEFPGHDITKLFRPGSKERIIKVNTPKVDGKGQKENLFVKIPSNNQNERNHLLYKADLYFCPDGAVQARGYNTIEVNTNRIIRLQIANQSDPFGGGAHIVTVKGFLSPTESGGLTWDKTKSRTVTVESARTDENFKVDFRISGDLIYTKIRNSRTNDIFKNYSISRFSGSNIKNVSFLEGAYKGISTFDSHENTFTGATEFRDLFYASAPSNSLLTDVQNYSLSTDSFYDDDAAPSVDTSSYSCSPRVDIEISMTADNDTLKNSLRPCFHSEFDNIQFCTNDSIVQQAQQNYQTACPPPGP